MPVPTAKLNTGASIPLLGFGTSGGLEGQEKADIVSYALKHGYRHIDTAVRYECEVDVGNGLKSSGVPREEIFLTTKIWHPHATQPTHTPSFNVKAEINASLARLGVDYVDLLLMHWPNGEFGPGAKPDFNGIWKEMTEVYKTTDKLRAIGVSNFSKKTMTELFEKGGDGFVVPAVNQIELSPDIPQFSEIEWMKSKGIHVTAWSPLGGIGSTLLTHPTVTSIADSHSVTTGQVLISWAIQRGTSVIPKSTSTKRVVQNNSLIILTPQEIALLNDKHKDPENPKRLDKGEAKTKMMWRWTYEEMGWEGLEEM